MLWLKAFHIVVVISWFAGLFYLPRIFVNHAMATESAEIARLKLMEHKLYRFVTPSLGWYWLPGYGYGLDLVFSGGWLYTKVALVLFLFAYHGYCGKLVKMFAADLNTRSHIFYRWFNEIPVLILIAVVILVTVKPF